ncbi:MAG TPA: phosphodiesterase [Casimicrobiaceae bacterium]|nr:phosphodiesterase [Casimicrobiaceae bacterium]
MLICQITDLHIKVPGALSYGVVDAAGYLRRCVAHVLALKQRPDIIVITGDLVDFGRGEEYAHLAELLQPLTMPVYLLAGNHDDREMLRVSFPAHAYLRQMDDFIQYAVDAGPLRLLALDSVIPGQSGGELCDRRIAWLDDRLSEAPDRPTVILMHHPPFSTGIGHMDQIGFANPADLADIVRRHPQVERILCGHLHRPIQARFAGTLASTCPGPAHQVALDLAPDAPSRFVLEPPGYQLHLWGERTGLISHTAFIGEFPGPYPFYHDGKLID